MSRKRVYPGACLEMFRGGGQIFTYELNASDTRKEKFEGFGKYHGRRFGRISNLEKEPSSGYQDELERGGGRDRRTDRKSIFYC